MAATHAGRRSAGASANFVVIALALIPVLWMVSLSFKTPRRSSTRRSSRRKWTWGNYSGILHQLAVHPAAAELDRHRPHRHVIAVVLASMAAYAVARLQFPGKGVLIGMALLIAMFPRSRW